MSKQSLEFQPNWPDALIVTLWSHLLKSPVKLHPQLRDPCASCAGYKPDLAPLTDQCDPAAPSRTPREAEASNYRSATAQPEERKAGAEAPPTGRRDTPWRPLSVPRYWGSECSQASLCQMLPLAGGAKEGGKGAGKNIGARGSTSVHRLGSAKSAAPNGVAGAFPLARSLRLPLLPSRLQPAREC